MQPFTTDSFLKVQFLRLAYPSAVIYGVQEALLADLPIAAVNFRFAGRKQAFGTIPKLLIPSPSCISHNAVKADAIRLSKF